MADRIPVPPASAQAFEAYQNRQPQNAGLIFERFVPDWREDSQAKKQGLESVREAAKKLDGALLAAFKQRWEQSVCSTHAQPFSLRTDWRLIAGLGRKGPLEVSFTFHRYGFAMLPGSSVKGIARAYAQLVEGKDEQDADFLAIFGRAPEKPGEDEKVAQCGRGVFFDAIPAAPPVLELDVMNPHYPGYYQGDDPPANWQSPVPVYFLTVAPGTEFRFAVGWRGVYNAEAEHRRQLAQDWLVQGLVQLGAGAKTSAGYGYFNLPSGEQPTVMSGPLTQQRETAPAAPTAAPQPPATGQEPAAPVQTRRGVVLEIRPDKRVGRVRDDETGREYGFSTDVCKGDMPGRKKPVVFELQNGKVISVRRA